MHVKVLTPADASQEVSRERGVVVDLPNVYTGSAESLVLDNHGLGAVLAAGHARGAEATAAAANDQVVGFLDNGSHVARRY